MRFPKIYFSYFVWFPLCDTPSQKSWKKITNKSFCFTFWLFASALPRAFFCVLSYPRIHTTVPIPIRTFVDIFLRRFPDVESKALFLAVSDECQKGMCESATVLLIADQCVVWAAVPAPHLALRIPWLTRIWVEQSEHGGQIQGKSRVKKKWERQKFAHH